MGKNKLGLGIENKRMRTARKGKEKTSSPEELERKNKAALYLRVSSEMQKIISVFLLRRKNV